MTTTTTAEQDQVEAGVPITELPADEARAFLLRSDSYCTLDLPRYFDFSPLLENVSKALTGRPLPFKDLHRASDSESVNHIIYSNKDGNFDWRPYELINPIIYVDLVNAITRCGSWATICRAFNRFRSSRIECASLPVHSTARRNGQEASVNRWWLDIEQRSIELALEYEYLATTDITDCYGSIYTHSVAWAIHTRKYAKDHRREPTIGNQIDRQLMAMHHGQTNGIPQGSELSNFVAELVLGWVDQQLDRLIDDAKVGSCKILRFRDDYRIFATNRGDVEIVLQRLSEAVRLAGFKLNVGKTSVTDDVVGNSMKSEKVVWLMRRPRRNNRLDWLLDIRNHGMEFPNAGSMKRSLVDYFRRSKRWKGGRVSETVLASVAIDIAVRNPRTYPEVAAILSSLVGRLGIEERRSIVAAMVNKLGKIPNSGHMEVWLSEIARHSDYETSFEEKLCSVVQGLPVKLWDCDWVGQEGLAAAVYTQDIVNRKRYEAMKLPFDDDEVGLFPDRYSEK